MEIFSVNTLEDFDTNKQKAVELVSDWTNGSEGEDLQMLPQAPEEIYKKQIALVAAYMDKPIGFIAASDAAEQNGQQMTEVGTLYVAKQFRKMGVGKLLVGLATAKVLEAGQIPYAFANNKSTGLFGEWYEPGCFADLPGIAKKLCLSCPKFTPESCCDKIMVYDQGDTQEADVHISPDHTG